MPTCRSQTKAKCPRCLIRPDLCYCAEIPSIATATKVVFVMHTGENKLTTNTARLAHFCLPHSEMLIRGLRHQQIDAAPLHAGNGHPVLLFPSEDAQLLTPEYAASLPRPLTLVVTDGSWRQAAKSIYREPALAKLPRVMLPPGPPSEYRLRHGAKPHMLCTIEATARALGIIEGPEVQVRLERIFRHKVALTLWARGILQYEAKRRGETPILPVF